MKSFKILLDTNVVLDALQKREPWNKDAESIILKVAGDKVDGYLTTKQLCDIWYLSKSIYSGEENTHKKCQKIISNLCKIFKILDLVSDDITEALAMERNDFEDAVMISIAMRYGLDGIVTRNVRDYISNNDNIEVWSPKEFINDIM